MTTDKIRALVAQKIAGQGSAVDVGGGLPTILNAICDALDAIPAPYTLPAATDTKLGGIKTGILESPEESALAPFGTRLSNVAPDTNRLGFPVMSLVAASGELFTFEDLTKEQAEAAIGDGSTNFIDDLISGKYAGVYMRGYYLPLSYTYHSGSSEVVFGGHDFSMNNGASYRIVKEGELYSATFWEV